MAPSTKRAKTDVETIKQPVEVPTKQVLEPVVTKAETTEESTEQDSTKPVNKYNECKKVAKTALSVLGHFNSKSYNDLTQLICSDKSKAEKELVAMVVLLQQRVPNATQYSMEAILKMKVGTLRKTAKSLLEASA